MFELEKLVRKNIRDLEPYSSARSEYTATTGIFLDANENPYGVLNRYPDPWQQKLRERLGRLNNLPAENIFIGNGSDEAIDLVLRVFCNPGQDKVLIFPPTYGMYKVAAAINDIALVELPLDNNFQIPWDTLIPLLKDPCLKVVFVCSPNNPTGNLINGLEQLLDHYHGIVVLDEAYIDFASRGSFLGQLEKYPNLIIMQTLSKAWGLAGARIGIAYASESILQFFMKSKPPYNVSRPNQEAAMRVLADVAGYEHRKTVILEQKEWIVNQLEKIPVVKKVYSSDANFLLVETVDASYVCKELQSLNVIVRNRHKEVADCIRITIGSPVENHILVDSLQKIAFPLKK